MNEQLPHFNREFCRMNKNVSLGEGLVGGKATTNFSTIIWLSYSNVLTTKCSISDFHGYNGKHM